MCKQYSNKYTGNYLRHSIIVVALLLSSLFCIAQKLYVVKGRVVNQPGDGVALATVALPGRVVNCDTLGYFTFAKISAGVHQFTISAVGYQPQVYTLLVQSDTSGLVFQLRSTTDSLKNFIVTARQQVIEQVKGKIVLNVEKSIAASGSTAYELLQRTPGVSIDANDNILLKGTAGVNILLDGKMTYMTPQQLVNTLKGMPSDNIAKIELMPTPGAEFDASGNAGVINIITKKSNKPGYAMNISSSTGAGHYLLNSENVTGNIRLKKINFYGTLGYNYRRTLMTRSSENTTGTGSDVFTFDRTSLEPYNSKFYTYKAGADWYINKHHQLTVAYNGSLDDWSKDATASTTISQQSGHTGSVYNHSVAVEPYYNNAVNLGYTFKPDSIGTVFSVDGDYISYRNHSDGFLSNQSYDKNGVATGPYEELKFRQPSFITIRSVKADMELPLPFARIKAGAKYASVSIDNNFRYDSLQNNVYVFAPSLSDHFLYSERIAAAYLSAEHRWNKTTILAGIRMEHTDVKGSAAASSYTNTRSYTNFFPSLSIDQVLSAKQSLSFNISRRITRPSYAELNPVKWYADKYSYYTGNPALQPELSWQFALTYMLDKYSATLSYNRLDNFISQTVVTDNNTGTVARQNANFSHQDRVDLTVLVPVQVCAYWNINATAGASFTAYPIAQKIGQVISSRFAGEAGINQSFTLPGSITAELNAYYHTGELNGIFSTRNYFMLDGGVKKSFMKKKLDLKLSFTDAFHTNRFEGYSLSDLSIYRYRYIPDSRRIMLTAVLKLGGKLANGRNRMTEEQQRL